MNERRQDNETVHLMRWSNMRFKRRLDIPMWHIEHLKKSIADLEELTEELKRIYTSNSLRHAEKCRYAQDALVSLNVKFRHMLPKDPRTRGSELLVYGNRGLEDESGYAELNARKDLAGAERQQKSHPYRRGKSFYGNR
jgi:hypothetical protein